VWVADPGGRCLHLFNLESREYRKITGMGTTDLLSPVGLCLGPPGTVLVCDSEAVSIHRFADRDGSWLGTLRLPEDLLRPVAAYYDPASEDLWVVDVLGHDLKVLDGGGALKRIVGRRGTGRGEFNYPCDIAAAEDRLWIADTGNHRVQAITRDGQPLVAFGQAGDASGDLAMPKSVSVDSFGHVYVVDGRFENVQVFDPEGKLLLFFGEEGTGPGQFWLPTDVFIEATNRIWIADTYNRRLQVFEHVPTATGSNGVN
jgi:streptogramin lyase